MNGTRDMWKSQKEERKVQKKILDNMMAKPPKLLIQEAQ